MTKKVNEQQKVLGIFAQIARALAPGKYLAQDLTAQLKAQRETSETEIAKLKSENQDLKIQVTNRGNDITTLGAQNSKLENAVNDLGDELRRVQEDKYDMARMIKQFLFESLGFDSDENWFEKLQCCITNSNNSLSDASYRLYKQNIASPEVQNITYDAIDDVITFPDSCICIELRQGIIRHTTKKYIALQILTADQADTLRSITILRQTEELRKARVAIKNKETVLTDAKSKLDNAKAQIEALQSQITELQAKKVRHKAK